MRLSAPDFERLMQPFEPFEKNPVLAVAVSGGRDSLALALLADAWARARQGRVLALIVDHGLRPQSAAEATATEATLTSQAIAAKILRWCHDSPTTGIQQAARAARYRLMFGACRDHGLLHLLVAHHAEDQAETVSMRAARASGPDGLAGMAALVEHADVRVLRPLLEIPRTRLTATLEDRGVRWIDDPSNSDPRFERARLRASGGARAAPGRAVEIRAAAETRLAEACVDTLEFDPAGELAIDRGRFAKLGTAVRARMLSRVLQAVGGSGHPPKRERIERALGRLAGPAERGKSGKARDFTLAACRLALRQAPGSRRLRWLVWSENGRNGGQPLVPAAFFACGAPAAHHVD